MEEKIDEYKKRQTYNLRLADMLRVAIQTSGELAIISDIAKEDNAELAELCNENTERLEKFTKDITKYINEH